MQAGDVGLKRKLAGLAGLKRHVRALALDAVHLEANGRKRSGQGSCLRGHALRDVQMRKTVFRRQIESQPFQVNRGNVDGLAGLQELAGDATMLYYTTDEAHEGSKAFLEKRKPDFKRFPRRP